MEKPTIYSSAPRPPKQIRIAENPVEPVVEKQNLPEKKEEQPSTITVMQPTVSKNTVVKLNSEKQDSSDLPKEHNDVSAENELPKTDEVISATPLADLETATDFTDGKQIVTVEKPAAAIGLEANKKEEVAAKEGNESVAAEEPKIPETEINTEAKSEIDTKSNEKDIPAETPTITDVDLKADTGSSVETEENDEISSIKKPELADVDVDAKAAAESSIETNENEDISDIEKPELAEVDVDTQAAAESSIDTKENEDNTLVEKPEIRDFEATTNEDSEIENEENSSKIDEPQGIIDVDAKSVDENVSPVTDEEVAPIPEQALETEPDAEFVTIAEQYSNSDIVDEIKPIIGTKSSIDKASKSGGSSKNKVDAEYDFENLKIPGDDELFQRQYYTMGEVATMFHANQSQIRFWENEFDILQPKKNKKGDRYFRPEDVKNLQVIHHLLRNRRFTIEGAREYLKSNKQRTQDTVSAIASLSQLKSFLIELKANL